MKPVRHGYGDEATWPAFSRDLRYADRNDPRFDNEAWDRLQEAAFEAGMTVDEFLKHDAEQARYDEDY